MYSPAHTHTARVRQKESEREKTAIIPNKPYRKSATMDFIFQFHSMYIFILLILDIFFCVHMYVLTTVCVCLYVAQQICTHLFIIIMHTCIDI